MFSQFCVLWIFFVHCVLVLQITRQNIKKILHWCNSKLFCTSFQIPLDFTAWFHIRQLLSRLRQALSFQNLFTDSASRWEVYRKNSFNQSLSIKTKIRDFFIIRDFYMPILTHASVQNRIFTMKYNSTSWPFFGQMELKGHSRNNKPAKTNLPIFSDVVTVAMSWKGISYTYSLLTYKEGLWKRKSALLLQKTFKYLESNICIIIIWLRYSLYPRCLGKKGV